MIELLLLKILVCANFFVPKQVVILKCAVRGRLGVGGSYAHQRHMMDGCYELFEIWFEWVVVPPV